MSVVGVPRGRKRRLEDEPEESVPAACVEDEESPHILDLPPDVLEAVLFDSCRSRYASVAELRRVRVCAQFGEACANILRTGFGKLESGLRLSVRVADEELQKELASGSAARTSHWSHTSKVLSLRLFQLQSLLSEVQIVRVSIQSYATCGLWTYYDGALLDKYFKLMRRLEERGARGRHHVESVAVMRGARRSAARYVRKFAKKVCGRLAEAQRRPDTGEVNAGVVATGIALLQTLESSLVAKRSKPVFDSSEDVSGNTSQDELPRFTRLRVQYAFNSCWIGMIEKSSEEALSTGNVDQLLQLLVVLRELVWITNMEHLRWQQLERFMFLFPHASSICSSDNVFVHSHASVSEFPTSVVNVADNFDGTRLFFYGHRSPVRYHTTDSSEVFLRPGYDARRQFLFDGRVFDYPTDLIAPCVLVEVDVMCDAGLLPSSLLEGTTCGGRSVGNRFSLDIRILSQADGDAKMLLDRTFNSQEIPIPVDETSKSESSLHENLPEEPIYNNCMDKVSPDTVRRLKSGEPFIKIRRIM